MISPLTILPGDARKTLASIPDGSVNCCVTSPPYWGLRDYKCDGQMGLESTPEAYVASMVGLFAEVRRTLADDGTLWLNVGDSYATNGGNHGGRTDNQPGVGAKRVHLKRLGYGKKTNPIHVIQVTEGQVVQVFDSESPKAGET